ncbi:MAG: hypothetical protein V2B18_20940 [Pseudomonadota bacterium]
MRVWPASYGPRAVAAVLRTMPVLAAAAILCISACINTVEAQGVLQFPGAPSGASLFGPPAPLPGTFQSSQGMEAREVSSLFVSNNWFDAVIPRVRNLELGCLYTFGAGSPKALFVADYFFPVTIGGTNTVFGEFHGRFENPIKSLLGTDAPDSNAQMLVGGGYRKRFSFGVMAGANFFFNRTRIAGNWHRSGAAGFEFAMLTFGQSLFTFNSTVYADFFGYAPGGLYYLLRRAADIRLEACIIHPLYGDELDLKLKVNQYMLHRVVEIKRGWAFGAELMGRDGWFRLVFDHGYDDLNGHWNNLGIHFSTGFDVTKLIEGKNPFTTP